MEAKLVYKDCKTFSQVYKFLAYEDKRESKYSKCNSRKTSISTFTLSFFLLQLLLKTEILIKSL